MKALTWLPLIIASSVWALISPRRIFISTYRPSSPAVRAATQDARNMSRLLAYKAKRAVDLSL